MTYLFENKLSLLGAGVSLAAITLLTGCGGGGGGSSTPTPTATPSPLDASYNATYTPSTAIPADGQAPTGNLTLARGRGTLQTTFYIQPSVVTSVQAAIDAGLRSQNVGFASPDNQVPSTIVFSGSSRLDSSGKLVLTTTKSVSVCGTATLTIDPTFSSNGTSSSGTGNYQITFPPNLVAKIRGQEFPIRTTPSGTVLTCNNLPLRTGTVTFTR